MPTKKAFTHDLLASKWPNKHFWRTFYFIDVQYQIRRRSESHQCGIEGKLSTPSKWAQGVTKSGHTGWCVSFKTDSSPVKARNDFTENLANLLIPTSYQHSWCYQGEFTLLVIFCSLPLCFFYPKSLDYMGASWLRKWRLQHLRKSPATAISLFLCVTKVALRHGALGQDLSGLPLSSSCLSPRKALFLTNSSAKPASTPSHQGVLLSSTW